MSTLNFLHAFIYLIIQVTLKLLIPNYHTQIARKMHFLTKVDFSISLNTELHIFAV